MKYYSYFKTFASLKEAISEVSGLNEALKSLQGIQDLEDLVSSELVFSHRGCEEDSWSAYGYSPSGDVYFYLSGNREIVAHFACYVTAAPYIPNGWELDLDPAECLDLNEVAIMHDLELLSLSLKWNYTTQGCIEFCALLDPTEAIFSIKRWHNEIAIGTILAMAVAELRHRTFDYYCVPIVEQAHLRALERAYRHSLQAVVTACCEALGLGCIALGTGDDRDVIVFRDREDIVEE